MKKIVTVLMASMIAGAVMTSATHAQSPTGVGYSPGAAFDKISWKSFIEVVTPAPSPNPNGSLTFETWATDAETFDAKTNPPVWPSGASEARNEKRFQRTFLGFHRPMGLKALVDDNGVPVPCSPPADAAAGNFPTPASAKPPTNCLAEEVRRNKPAFDYIVNNNLYSASGLQANFPSKQAVEFPQSSDLKKAGVEIKIDWVPVNTVVTWLNKNLKQPVNAAFVKKNYFITQQKDGTAYAMVSMHISIKDRPNWLWATFEHQMNPGRCDTMGCYDKFGMPASLAAIPPVATANTQYPKCSSKSPALVAMFKGLPAVWKNYCLKDTQIDYVSTQAKTKGQPVLNGDSVVERILAGVPIAQSSCISCHAYAAFSSKGCVASNNPGINNPAPIGTVTPQPGQKQYDFVWGLITMPNSVCQ
ncbi:MAG TPA: hypothetical protein VG962_14710 [Steroidobacteraceae bacterium]|nr:hypothetical protein [Steroidobacteraceae bacterium]